jgi:hypothetical protein
VLYVQTTAFQTDIGIVLTHLQRDEHLIVIVRNLLLLEDFYVNGLELNDVVLESVAALENLRNVTFSGISKFTVDGLLDFVSRLGPNNSGIRVSIDMADPDTMLPEDSVNMIRECLVEKTGGTLEYMALRGMETHGLYRSPDHYGTNLIDADPNVSEFESDSD